MIKRLGVSHVKVSAMLAAIGVSAGLAMMPVGQPAHAADVEKPLQWLQGQRLTLFDWGLWRLERDIDRVGRWMEDAEALSEPALTGVEWQRRRQRVTVFVSIVRRPALRNAAHCQHLYGVVRRKLLGAKGPTGPGSASWYLRTKFLPQGRGWTRPSQNFAERLVKLVYLELTLLSEAAEGLHLKAPKISCAGTLDAERATARKHAVN